jgi:hypothetical protein
MDKECLNSEGYLPSLPREEIQLSALHQQGFDETK